MMSVYIQLKIHFKKYIYVFFFKLSVNSLILYSKSIIMSSGESLVLLIALWIEDWTFCGEDEGATFLCDTGEWESLSSSSLSEIKSITTARFFSFGVCVEGFDSSAKKNYCVFSTRDNYLLFSLVLQNIESVFTV